MARRIAALRTALTRVVAYVALAVALASVCTAPATADRLAFARPLEGLSEAEAKLFAAGNALFMTRFEAVDGLGPLYNRANCSGCHRLAGRGRPPLGQGAAMLSMLVRLSVPGTGGHGAPRPHPAYGAQLQERAIAGVAPEGRAIVEYRRVDGRYADGEPYTLRKPNYGFYQLAYGQFTDNVMYSARVAPALIGLGLLEAVDDREILARADAGDRDGDGISGRPNRVWDHAAGTHRLGRFGWKANHPSVLQQNAHALVGDMGLTSSLVPRESCTEAQTACRTTAASGTPEITDERLRALAFYVRMLAPPGRRGVDDPVVRRGERLFEKAGCGACHTPRMTTGPDPVMALAHREFQPYSDLLLHDMGEGLADGRPDFAASGAEWRTPPLWGIGLVEAVNKHTLFLHDGRARGLAEAILWHGGEGEAAKQAFRHMAKAERAALLAFLGSL
jgi:CxxC motif-containing protein (DUF1111 family)